MSLDQVDIKEAVVRALDEVLANGLYSYFEGPKVSITVNVSLTKDGDRWCALHGDNIQDGICGWGTTPQEAMTDFKRKLEDE